MAREGLAEVTFDLKGEEPGMGKSGGSVNVVCRDCVHAFNV